MDLQNNLKEVGKANSKEKQNQKEILSNYETIMLNQFYEQLANKHLRNTKVSFLQNLHDRKGESERDLTHPIFGHHHQFSDTLFLSKAAQLPNIQFRLKKSFQQKILVNQTIYIHERIPIKNAQHSHMAKKYSMQKSQKRKISSIVPKFSSNSTKKIVNLEVIDSDQQKQKDGSLFFSPRKEAKRHKSYKRINGKSNTKLYQYPVEERDRLLKVEADHSIVNKSQLREIYHQKSRIEMLIDHYKAIKLKKARDNLSIDDKHILTGIEQMQKIKIKGEQTIYFEKIEPKLAKKDRSITTNIPKFKFFNWKTKELPFTDINKSQLNKLLSMYLFTKEVVPASSGHYKVYVGEGNNGQLVARLLKNRGWWTSTDNISQANLVWTQLPVEEQMKKLVSHEQIKLSPNSRDYLLLTSQFAQESDQIRHFLKYKHSRFFAACEKLLTPAVYHKFMLDFISKFKENLYLKSYSSLREVISKFYENRQLLNVESKSLKLINHCQNSNQIGDKKQLLYHIEKYCSIKMIDRHSMIPRTIHINESDIQRLKADNNETTLRQKLALFDQEETLYILKPGQQTNRGNGITVHPSKQALVQFISQSLITFPENKTYIVQEYIDPLLYEGRKFDIRVWALYANNRIWFYREGYIRTSCKEYTIKNMNKYVHLTNDAVQKYNEEYGKYEPANKVSFNDLDKYLKKTCNYDGFYSEIYKNIKMLTKRLFEVGNLMIGRSCHQFELFGLDFLIDRDYKVWMIECNTNPSIEICCSLLNRLVPNMLENLLTIVVDPLFPGVERKMKQDEEWNVQRFNFELLLDGVLETSYLQTVIGSDQTYYDEIALINSHKLPQQSL